MIPLPRGFGLWPEARLRSTGVETAVARDLAGDHRAALATIRAQLLEETPAAAALAWQNPQLLEHARKKLADDDLPAKKRGRQLLRTLARYLARYATKNETVGFFGPVCWVRLDGDALEQRPGAGLVRESRVFLEPWAARMLVEDHGDAAFPERVLARAHPRARAETLPDACGRALVELAAEPRPLLELAEAALARGFGEDVVIETLDALRRAGTLEVGIPVSLPSDPLDQLPYDELRPHLDALAAEPLSATKVLAHSRALTSALGELSPRATGRDAGQTYAARTPFFLTTTRDLALTLPAARFARAGHLLSFLGLASRAYTHRVAQRFLDELDALVLELGGLPLPFERLVANLGRLYDARGLRAAADAADEFDARWRALALELGEAREGAIHLDGARLLEAAAAAFEDAPCPGWPAARHCSPDLMLDAQDRLVLGEVHVGHNSLGSWQGVLHHPDPAALRARYAQDIPQAIVAEVPLRDYALCAHDAFLDPEKDWSLATGAPYRGPLGPARELLARDLVLVREGGRLVGRHRHRDLCFDALRLLERAVKLASVSGLSLSAPREGVRVLVDDVVVARRRWRVEGGALRALGRARGDQRHARVRALGEARGWPRRLFVKSDAEVKPAYLDLEAEVLTSAVCGLAAHAARLDFSEMLPDLDDAWIEDARGARYTSELRCVLVDPEPWRPLERA